MHRAAKKKKKKKKKITQEEKKKKISQNGGTFKNGTRIFRIQLAMGEGSFGVVTPCRYNQKPAVVKSIKNRVSFLFDAITFVREVCVYNVQKRMHRSYCGRSNKIMAQPKNSYLVLESFDEDLHLYMKKANRRRTEKTEEDVKRLKGLSGEKKVVVFNSPETQPNVPLFPVPDCWKIVKDLFLHMSNMHDDGILHRDIKPSNIMRSSGRIVFVDFGASVVVANVDLAHMLANDETTFIFLAPCYADKKGQVKMDKMIDLWAMLITWAFLMGHPLYRDAQDHISCIQSCRAYWDGQTRERVVKMLDQCRAEEENRASWLQLYDLCMHKMREGPGTHLSEEETQLLTSVGYARASRIVPDMYVFCGVHTNKMFLATKEFKAEAPRCPEMLSRDKMRDWGVLFSRESNVVSINVARTFHLYDNVFLEGNPKLACIERTPPEVLFFVMFLLVHYMTGTDVEFEEAAESFQRCFTQYKLKESVIGELLAAVCNSMHYHFYPLCNADLFVGPRSYQYMYLHHTLKFQTDPHFCSLNILEKHYCVVRRLQEGNGKEEEDLLKLVL